jgi:RND family efflux transporter MFP subunit
MSSSAPIFSVNDDARARAESAAWAQFAAAKDSADYCTGWLAILCSQIERVKGALVVLGPDSQGSYAAAAVWPDASQDMTHLGPVAERTLKERRGLVEGRRIEGRADHPTHVGYPIEVSGQLHGAVVLDIHPRADHEVQRALRQLHWASAWLVDQFRQQALAAQGRQLQRMATTTAMVATALQEPRVGAAALTLANELAAKLECSRVSLGFEHHGSTRVEAISNTATFDRRTDLARSIADAMDEVLDLNLPAVHPPLLADAIDNPAHRHLAERAGDGSACSVPLVHAGHSIGVLTLERAEPFDAHAVELARTLGLLLGPILELKRENERALWRRLLDRSLEAGRALWGPGHAGTKLVAGVAAVLLVLLAVVDVPYRVASKTAIEGAVQRSLVAPFDGFVAESLVRAGETVKKGQPMARLDDRTLRLEHARWLAERDQADRKFRQAAAAQDRAGMLVYQAQMDQAQAQFDLVQDRLARAAILAPFDAVVVAGDLSQLQGAPVEVGKVLFEVAPLDAYRVVLQVDERDIAELRSGQRGELAMAGIPNETMAFVVSNITPVSTSQDGRNFFRVEAGLDKASPRLRPGMEGVGKVAVGERKLLWVWTHGLTDWLRLWMWKWWL